MVTSGIRIYSCLFASPNISCFVVGTLAQRDDSLSVINGLYRRRMLCLISLQFMQTARYGFAMELVGLQSTSGA